MSAALADLWSDEDNAIRRDLMRLTWPRSQMWIRPHKNMVPPAICSRVHSCMLRNASLLFYSYTVPPLAGRSSCCFSMTLHLLHASSLSCKHVMITSEAMNFSWMQACFHLRYRHDQHIKRWSPVKRYHTAVTTPRQLDSIFSSSGSSGQLQLIPPTPLNGRMINSKYTFFSECPQ